MSHPVQVCVALYPKLHSASRAESSHDDWATGLPAPWRDAAVALLDYRRWRLRDGRWLNWRPVERGWGEERRFFHFSEEMPR